MGSSGRGRIHRAALAGVLLAAWTPAAGGQPAVPAGRTAYRIVTPASVVGFDARATPVGSFGGETREVEGELLVDLADLGKGVGGSVAARAATLRTGIGLRDSDLQVVMETERYPLIRFTVERVESPKASLAPGDEVEVAVTGTMEIHGVRRSLRLPVRVAVAPDRFTVTGGALLRMSDYGIRPPRVFLFIRTEDEVRIRFTLVAEPRR